MSKLFSIKSDELGLSAVFALYPGLAPHYRTLTQQLLVSQASDTFGRWEREIYAAYCAFYNQCEFCNNLHLSSAWLVDQARTEEVTRHWDINDHRSFRKPEGKLGAIMEMAERFLDLDTPEEDEWSALRLMGFTDHDIQDMALIAAHMTSLSIMVQGLGCTAPANLQWYEAAARYIRDHGYQAVTVQEQQADATPA